ncbi:MAG: hypothetical protein ACLVKI_05660 [Gordonibacter urolithinfaciens]
MPATRRRARARAALVSESLVVGGDLTAPLAGRWTRSAARPARRLPPGRRGAHAIDPEHGAIYQCLLGEDAREVAACG